MEVVSGLGNNREEQLILLIAQYEKDLLRMCYAYLRDLPLAEDAVQETFLRVYKGLDDFRGESSVKTWIMSIAINICKNIRKSAWHRYVDHRISMDQICLTSPSRQPSAEQMELTGEIMRLPRKQMEVILLYYFQGMETKEIAETLAITTQAVYLRLKKARAKLKHALEGGIDDET